MLFCARVFRSPVQHSPRPLALGLALFAMMGAARGVSAQEHCQLSGVRVAPRGAFEEVRIQTTCAAAFHALRLQDPPRLVVDIPAAHAGTLVGILPVGGQTVRQVHIVQTGSAEAPVGRVELELTQDVGYESARDGAHDILLRLRRPENAQEATPVAQGAERAFVPGPLTVPTAEAPEARRGADAPAPSAAKTAEAGPPPALPPAGQPAAGLASQAPLDAPPGPAPTRPAAPAPAGPAKAPPSPASARPAGDAEAPGPTPTEPPAAPRGRPLILLSMRAQGSGALLRLNGTPSYTTSRLEQPPRLVVDIRAAKSRQPKMRLRGRPAWLRGVRLGQQDAHLRVVFDLTDTRALEVQPRAEGLWVGPPSPTARLARPKPAPGGQKAGVPAPAQLTGLHVSHTQAPGGGQTRIFLSCDGNATAHVDTSHARAWILALDGATLVPALERTWDTRPHAGPISLVSAFQAERTPAKVHVVASLTQAAEQRLTKVLGGYIWQIDGQAQRADGRPATGAAAPAPAAAPALPRKGRVLAQRPAAAEERASAAFLRTAGFQADAAAPLGLPAQFPSAGGALRNHRISLDVKDADIINVLRLISEETGENIIASDEVKGKITLKLRNVPAEQALDTVLRIKGFDRVRQNNILRIASADSIQKERDLEVARKRALIEVEEVAIRMVTINYASATEVVEQLKPMLSARGSLQVDQRTNTLILQDVASNVERLTELARRLDKQTPLVNIQARIVEASSSFARDLGVQWGGATQHSARSGNPTGVYFPADVTASGAADLATANQGAGVVSPSRYAVNFPALLAGQGAGLGFVLGSAGGAQLLDLRLSAMESNGNGKIISSPEVSTLDNKTARVSQGIEIPVSTVSAAGTNVRFVPAVLQLEVTPHVTNDGTVLMKIHVEKSAPDFTQKGAQGDPTINKRQAETEVLVRDGDTSVIGGILTRETSDSRSEVPFFARIPILGNLFRRHQSAETRAELLVFITPRIINREASTVQAGSVFDRTNN